MSSQVLPKQQDSALDSWIRLIRGYASVTRAMSAELVAEHGLTINDYEALLHLSQAEEGRMRRVDLAGLLLLTASGVTRLLDGLEAAGLVERASCARDRRVTYAVLTDAGRTRAAPGLGVTRRRRPGVLRGALQRTRSSSSSRACSVGFPAPPTRATKPARRLAAAAAHSLELLPRLVVERVAEMMRRLLAVRDGFHLADEGCGRALLNLLTRRAAHRAVGGDEADDLGGPVLGGESLEHRVGVLRVTHLERAVRLVRPGAVEDEVARARP